MKNKIHNLLLLVPIIIIIACMYSLLMDKRDGYAADLTESGTLNLEYWDFSDNKLLSLNGEWNFYPGLLMEDINDQSDSYVTSIPHLWNEDPDLNNSPYGYGTYQLHITGLEPLRIYGVEILDEATSYALYANRVEVASNGIVGRDRSEYTPVWHPAQGAFQANENGEVDIAIEISNFDYCRGGFWNSIKIGNVQAVAANVNNSKILDTFLFSSMLIVGFLYFGLSTIYLKDKTTLYFSIFCFAASFRIIMIGQRIISDLIPVMNWYTHIRLEYLSGYILLPLFGLFMIHLCESGKFSTIFKYILMGFVVSSFVVTLLFPIPLFTSLLKIFGWTAMVFALYSTFLVVKAIIKRKTGAVLMLIALIGIIAALYFEFFIGGAMSWLPIAGLNLVILFSIVTFLQFMNVIRENETLETKLTIDPLTGLFNRSYLLENETISSNAEDHKKYLMFLDLDNFKSINDTFGHKIGDYILQESGHRLSDLLKETDILCRFGGDEFIIIYNDLQDDIREFAETIIQTMKQPFSKDDIRYNIGVSIGITEIDTSIKNIETVIRYGDEAMYVAKRNGGGRYAIW